MSPRCDRGFVTIEYVLAVGLSMVVLVIIANVVVFEYGHGVVRAAVDQGVREGARTSSPVVSCQTAAQQVIDDLLGGRSGPMGSGVSITCTQVGSNLAATAHARFQAWLRPIPDWTFSASASGAIEGTP